MLGRQLHRLWFPVGKRDKRACELPLAMLHVFFVRLKYFTLVINILKHIEENEENGLYARKRRDFERP